MDSSSFSSGSETEEEPHKLEQGRNKEVEQTNSVNGDDKGRKKRITRAATTRKKNEAVSSASSQSSDSESETSPSGSEEDDEEESSSSDMSSSEEEEDEESDASVAEARPSSTSKNRVVNNPELSPEVAIPMTSSSSNLAATQGLAQSASPSRKRTSEVQEKNLSRKDKKLSLIAAKFVEYLGDAEDRDLDIALISMQMGVKKRRIYDVVNVLEGCNLVHKAARSKVRWCAPFPVSRLPPLEERLRQVMDEDAGAEGRRRSGKRRRTLLATSEAESTPGSPLLHLLDVNKVPSLKRIERMLDSAISAVNQRFPYVLSSTTVPVSRILDSLPQNRKLIAVEMPTAGPAAVRVHAPVIGPNNQTQSYTTSVTLEEPSSKDSLAVGILDAKHGTIIRGEVDPPPAPIPINASACSLFLFAAPSSVNMTQEEVALTQDTVGTIDRATPSLSQPY